MSDHPEIDRLINRYGDLKACRNEIKQAFQLLHDSFSQGGVLLACGTGGSAAASDHLVAELMKGFQRKRPVPAAFSEQLGTLGTRGEILAKQLQGSLPAISLTSHGALVSAIASEQAPDLIFAQQVYGYARAGDVLLGLCTTPGESIANAFRVARALGSTTIALTGRDSGELRELADCVISVPRITTAEIQELHLPVSHALTVMLEQAFFN